MKKFGCLQILLPYLLLYFPTSMAWTWKPLAVSTPGPKVSGHVAVSHQGNLFVYGGLTGNAGSPCSSDLWHFADTNDEKANWKLVEMAGTGPGPRMYQAAAVLDDTLYVMGGWDPGEKGSGGTFFDDIWTLDLTNNDLKWKKSNDPLPCGPVSRHAACVVGDKIIVHTFRGVVTFDGNDWKLQETTGDAPTELSMCAMAPLSETTCVVLGGSTKTQQLSNDAFVLNTETWHWTRLDCSKGEKPYARASPCACRVGDNTNQCMLFGGASLAASGYEGGAGLQAQGDTWLLTVDDDDGTTGTWKRVDTVESPSPRLAATLSKSADGRMLLQGGWDPKGKTFDDIWILVD